MTCSPLPTIVSAGLSRAETDRVTPLQLFLHPSRLVENLWRKLVLKEGATTYEKNEPEQKQGGEGAVELLLTESHATASLISKCCPPQL